MVRRVLRRVVDVVAVDERGKAVVVGVDISVCEVDEIGSMFAIEASMVVS